MDVSLTVTGIVTPTGMDQYESILEHTDLYDVQCELISYHDELKSMTVAYCSGHLRIAKGAPKGPEKMHRPWQSSGLPFAVFLPKP